MDQVPAHPGGPRAHVDGVWASGSSESRPPARGTQVLLQLWVTRPVSPIFYAFSCQWQNAALLHILLCMFCNRLIHSKDCE